MWPLCPIHSLKGDTLSGIDGTSQMALNNPDLLKTEWLIFFISNIESHDNFLYVLWLKKEEIKCSNVLTLLHHCPFSGNGASYAKKKKDHPRSDDAKHIVSLNGSQWIYLV